MKTIIILIIIAVIIWVIYEIKNPYEPTDEELNKWEEYK